MPAAATLIALIATALQAAFAALGLPPGGMSQNPLWVVLFLGCGLLLRDFVSFYTHMLQHRVEVLWEFHKVHHAPESLGPADLASHPPDGAASPTSSPKASCWAFSWACSGWLTPR